APSSTPIPYPPPFRSVVLLRVALRILPSGGWREQSAIGLIFGGAVGNLIDRTRFGAVVDFVDVYVRDWHWPAFNVADSAITAGVAALALVVVFERSPAAPYEDDHVLVVDKPAGMVVHPGAGRSSGTLAAAILAHAPTTAGVGGPRRPGIVHRLDKDTSGLLVVAKTPRAYDDLVEQLA